MSIRIISPGFYSTIQDLGRTGFQQYGLPVSGAMDELAFRVGNILLGNPENTPAIEFTYAGLVIEVQKTCLVAITGGDFHVINADGKQIPCWKSTLLEAGAQLKVTGAARGCRGYLAVSGGFDIPLAMGSCATYLRGKIGGYKGRLLMAEDILPMKEGHTNRPDQAVPLGILQEYYPMDAPIRVIQGPQYSQFTKEAIETFFSSPYVITHDSDRMGYRLEGPKLTHLLGADIISDGIPIGAIQIPGNGMPVIMQADRQTTGGYTKIANVITVDLPRLAQMVPGETIYFTQVSLERAHQLLKKFYWDMKYIGLIHQEKNNKAFQIKIGNEKYNVFVEKIPE